MLFPITQSGGSSPATLDGAFEAQFESKLGYNGYNVTTNWCTKLTMDASKSNSIYTDSGKVMPLSISKQSIIIYK